ncbi:MAG TPA: hypothetical protein VK184_18030 [Nostocaceae cyanobacterium]|nr:hypothetical protein [Nostocaceae cyanobacterium]
MTLYLDNPNRRRFFKKFSFINWKNLFSIFSTNKISSQELAEINSLVNRLSLISNIQQIRVVAYNPNDWQEITVDVLSDVEADKRMNLAKEILSLAIEAEWKLDEISKNKSWDFGVRILDKFEYNINHNQVIISKDVEQKHLPAAS